MEKEQLFKCSLDIKSTQDPIALTKKEHEDIRKIATQEMNESTRPIKGIYVDISCLRDIRLGALITLSDEEDRKIILSNLSRYNERLDNDTILSFPGIKVTEKDIDTYLSNTDNVDFMLLTSPTTTLTKELSNTVYLVRKNNAVSSTESVRLTINFYPYKPSPEVIDYYHQFILSIDPSIRLSVITNKPLMRIEEKDIIVNDKPIYDIFFIDHPYSLIGEDSTLYHPTVNQLKFLDVSVFAPRRVDRSLKNIDNALRDKEKAFETTEAFIGLFMKFKYLDFSIE